MKPCVPRRRGSTTDLMPFAREEVCKPSASKGGRLLRPFLFCLCAFFAWLVSVSFSRIVVSSRFLDCIQLTTIHLNDAQIAAFAQH